MSDFYNKYPYTDFHELNLDWVIERVKKLTEDWISTKEAWEGTEADWQELYNYVHDYFNNLDVQNEINAKIDAMILDGSFATIVTPIIDAQVADTVAAWLAEHITPTTPAVDDTLSVLGAAADSKTVGDRALLDYGYIDDNTDLNDCIVNGFYTIVPARTLSNAPDNYASSNSALLVYAAVNNSPTAQITQLYFNYSTNTVHIRFKQANDTWASWKLINIDTKGFTTKGYIVNNTDLNDLKLEGYYTVLPNRTLTNAPSDYANSSSAILILPTVDNELSPAQLNQVYFNYSKNTLWIRFREVNTGTWAAWKQINAFTDTKGFTTKGYIDNNTDLNTVFTEGYYIVLQNRTLSNAPDNYANSNALFINYPAADASTVAGIHQLYYNFSFNTLHYRIKLPNGSFGDWKLMNPKENFLQNGNVLAQTTFYSEYTGNNVGTNLNIMLYNVAHYSKFVGHMIGDSGYETYLTNFKKLLQHINPDVCFICEDTQYIDTAGTKESEKYLYNYSMPTTTGYSETTIKSKIAFDDVQGDTTSPGRPSVYAIWNNLDSKKVLLYCAHLVPTSGAESTRLSELEHIFSVIQTENPDAFIICGDLNTQTATDKTNLLQVCSDNNARLANGSWLGWIQTTLDYPTDNIIVSDNIFINKFDVLSDIYPELFSDHNPVAINITIT